MDRELAKQSLLPLSALIPKQPGPDDFCSFVPWACNQFSAGFSVFITKIQIAYADRSLTDRSYAKSKSKKLSTTEEDSGDMERNESFLRVTKDTIAVYIRAMYNGENSLEQLKISKSLTPPRLLLKIIGLTLPFHPQLHSLIFESADKTTIYEITHLLTHSNITEVRLDGTRVPEANYHILLDGPNKINILSLSMCHISDSVLHTLAMKLTHDTTGGRTLSVLNLASNQITDIGAKYLAEALRSNRKLSYLNLSDNMITDEGAAYLFDIFHDFALTEEELSGLIQRRLLYLQKEKNLTSKLLNMYKTDNIEKGPENRKCTRLDISPILSGVDKSLRAKSAAQKKLGEFNDPFSQRETSIKDGVVYSLGNNSLCYLNLAYNNLSYFSVKALLNVLVYQRNINRIPRGLITIRIQGNFLPAHCVEYTEIDKILEGNLVKKNPPKKTTSSKSKK